MSGGTGNFLHLSEKGERVMSKQVLRSGTSVGTNITEGAPVTQSLLADSDELIRLLASSIKTARSKS